MRDFVAPHVGFEPAQNGIRFAHRLAGNTAEQPEPRPDTAVGRIYRLAIHHRTPSNDALDAARLAVENRFLGHATLTE